MATEKYLEKMPQRLLGKKIREAAAHCAVGNQVARSIPSLTQSYFFSL